VNLDILGIILSVLCLGAIGWNIYKTEKHIIQGSTVTLIIILITTIVMAFGDGSIEFPWVKKAQQAKEAADQASISAKIALEALAIQEWNRGRRASDEKAVKKQETRAIELLKSVYGTEYLPRVKKLVEEGYILTPTLEALGITKDTPSSSLEPYFKSFESNQRN